MLRHTLHFLLLALVSTVTVPVAASASAESAFERVVHGYEATRLSLLNDTLEGVAEEAEGIATVVEGLAAELTPQNATVSAADIDQIRELLPQIREAVQDLAAADSLEEARAAFYELSKPLVRWRKIATVEVPAVAYCPMAKKSWLQPEGTIGNPYYGQSMATCGDIVPDR